MSAPLAEIALLRLSAFDPRRLAAFRAPRTCALLDEAAELALARDRALARLLEAAREAVRGLDDRSLRRELLTLQRDGHNRRFARLAKLAPEQLPAPVAAAARELTDLLERGTAADSEVQQAFAEETTRTSELLQASARDPRVRDAVGGATSSLERALDELARGLSKGKTRRDAENSLALYLARGAAKTSPLGRLGLTTPGFVDARPDAAAQSVRAGATVRHHAVPNLAWLSQCAEASYRAGEAPLTVAEHVVDDGIVYLLRRDETVRPNLPRLQGAHETVVQIKGIVPLLSILRGLPLPATARDLTRALERADVPGAGALVERLAQLRLLRPVPPLPMQAWHSLDAFASAMASRGPLSAQIADSLRAAADALAGLSLRPAGDRHVAVAKALAILSSGCSGREVPPAATAPEVATRDSAPSVVPTPCVFEDTVLPTGCAHLGAVALGGALDDLGTLLSVGAAAGLDWARRRTIAERLRRRYGARPVPLLAAGMAVIREEQSEGVAKTNVNPLGLADVAAQLAARAELPNRLRPLVERDCDGNVQLPAAALAESWSALWPHASARQLVSAFVQVLDGEAPRLVLNGATGGGGRLLSRFLAASDDCGEAVAALRRHYDRLGVPFVIEVDSVLGFNANLHPAMTPFAVDYPGLPSHAGETLPLSDLWLCTRGEPALPQVTRGEQGPAVALLNLGFLSEELLPPLMRFFCALGQQAAPSLDWLQARGRVADCPGVTIEPRVSVGAVIVRRRSWRVDAAVLPDGNDPLARFAALRALLRAAGAPLRSFARAQYRRPEDESAPAIPRDEKPTWLDLDSPLYVRLLQRIARPDVISALRLTEALPDPEHSGIHFGDELRAAEWVVELLT